MDFSDAADLLGSNEMPVRKSWFWSLLRGSLFFVLYMSVGLASFVAIYNGRSWLRNWREYNYKKSVRRKYGIPDSNNEPFNVAYAKAEQRRREMAQQQASSRTLDRLAVEDTYSQDGVDPSMPHPHIVPKPSIISNVQRTGVPSVSDSRPITSQSSSSKLRDDGSHSSFQPLAVSEEATDIAANDYGTIPSQRKRSLEKDDENETSKKIRNCHAEQADVTADDSLMDVVGDEVPDASAPGPSRGAKRQAGSDEELANAGSVGKKAGKRARRQSKKPQDIFRGDENDKLMNLEHFSRGKKRDWTEAGSSFGGDDESPAGGQERKARRQKRKSIASMTMDDDSQSRGIKRSFDIESTPGSDDEDGSISRSKSSRKRGKHMVNDLHDISDVSMYDLVPDASCEGRKIGEEWQENGEIFKVGLDGRRLRQVLLRKRRSRFSMPEDSQHPDSQAHLEILFETWLNDDKYTAAEERGDIFNPEKGSKEARKLNSFKAGKQLLWSTSQTEVTSLKSAAKNSAVANVRTNGDPFERPSLTGYTKRVSIGSESPLPSPTASPVIRSSKSYSKWEKQDLEAEAMVKLRKKLEEQKKETVPVAKRVSFQLPPSSSESPSIASPLPSSSSAPAAMPALTTLSKAETPAAPASSNHLTALSGNSGETSRTTFSSTTANEPIQLKPSATASASSQSSKEPPLTPQVQSVVTPFKSQSNASGRGGPVPSSASATSSMSNPFAQMTQNGAAASANMLAKPATPANGPISVNGASGAPSSFSFGSKDAAQNVKPAQSASSFSFPKAPEKVTSSAPSPFGAQSKENSGGAGISSFKFGAASTNARQQAPVSTGSGPGVGTSQFSFDASSAKGPESSSKFTTVQAHSGSSRSVPKFSFGIAPKTAPPIATNQPSVPASAPKSAPTTSSFSFGTNTAGQDKSTGDSAPTSSSTAAAPKFSFDAGSSTGTSSLPAPAMSNNAFGATSAKTGNAPATAAAPAAGGFSFNFGGTKPATSAFGNPPSGSSPFGSTAKPSAASSSPFNATSTAFGGTSNTASTSSPFGAPAKAASDAPKPLFGFGSNGTSGSTAATTEKQENKPSFSFNFGATPASSSNAFGSSTAENGLSGGPVFGTTGSGPTSTPTFTFNAKTAGSVFGVPAGNTDSNKPPAPNAFGSTNGSSVFGGQK